MAISDKITSIEQHIGDAYDSLNKIGETAQNKNIENIAGLVDNIYNKFPKTEYAEGSNVTLANTLKAKLDFDKLEGDTEQESTTGKNKLPVPYAYSSQTRDGITFTVNSDGSITANGTATGNATFVLQFQTQELRNLLLNNDCILNGCPSGSNNTYKLQLYGYNASGSGALADYGNGVSLSNFVNETNNFNIAIVIPSGTIINTPIIFKPMIRLSSVTDGTYEKYTNGPAPSPSYPFSVKSVTGEQEVIVRGTNIIGLDTNQYKVSLKTGDKITFKNEGSNALTLNMFTNFGDITRNDYWSVGSNATRTIVVAHDTNAIAWASAPDSTAWGNYGDTIANYEPYITPITKTLNLGDEEYCGIENYKDTIFKNSPNNAMYDENLELDSWYIHKETEKVTLNGNEEWTVVWNNTDRYGYRTDLTNAKYPTSQGAFFQIYTNYYLPYIQNILYYDTTHEEFTKYGCCVRANYSQIIVKNNDLTTLDSFKTWLSTHNLEVVYQLATPTNTKITDTDLISQLEEIDNLQSNNGTTIIETDGDLSLIVKVRGLKNS